MGASGRARLPNTQTSGSFQVIALGQGEDNQNRDYKRRRPHKKTRTGCQACKQRRVKCDQAMPNCLRCRRNHRECVYTSADGAGGDPNPKIEEDDSEAPLLASIEPAPGRTYERSIPVRQGAGHNAAASGSRQLGTAGRRPPAAFRMARRNKDAGSATNAALVPSEVVAAANKPNFRFFHNVPFPVTTPEYGTPSIELLHHFETTAATVFAMPHFTGSLLPMAMQFPHLRGTVLAVAAAHLCNRVPACKDYRIAGLYQQNVALRFYQKALATPLVVQGQVGVDALLMTGMLMNMLAFILPTEDTDDAMVWVGETDPETANMNLHANSFSSTNADTDPDPRRSWVFSPHPNRLGWMALQMGLKPLLEATEPWRKNSFLRPLFANADDERRTLTGTWQSLHRVPQAWLDLFGFDKKSTPLPIYRRGSATSKQTTPNVSPVGTPGPSGGRGMSVASNTSSSSEGSSSGGSSGDTPMISEADRLYRAPLRVLAEIRMIPPTGRYVLAYFQFMGHLHQDFRHKLFIRDEKALWLFGMWVGMLCRFNDVWWVRRRVRCDFRAIRLWLHLVGVANRPGDEGRLWQQLLKDMDATWGYDFNADTVTI